MSLRTLPRMKTTAAFPDGVDAAGPSKALGSERRRSILQSSGALTPEDRVVQTMADLFGPIRLYQDSVVAWGKKKAEEFRSWRRGSANSWLELACAMSTKRAFALTAKAIGCDCTRLDGQP